MQRRLSSEKKVTASSLGRCRRGYGSPYEVCLLQNNGSGANLLRGVDFGLGKGGGGFEGHHLLVAGFDGERSDVSFGKGVLELLEERGEGNGTTSALVVGCT